MTNLERVRVAALAAGAVAAECKVKVKDGAEQAHLIVTMTDGRKCRKTIPLPTSRRCVTDWVRSEASGRRANTSSEVFEAVASWADRRKVDYSIFRDIDNWSVQLRFSDSRGSFSGYFDLPERCDTTKLEADLGKACAQIRQRRIGRPALYRAA